MNISGFPGGKDGEVVQHVFLSEQTKFGGWEFFKSSLKLHVSPLKLHMRK